MKIISNKLTVCIVFSFLMLNSNAIKAQEKLPYQNSKLKIEERINDLLPRMTLEEKVNYVTGGILSNNQESINGIERLSIPDFVIAHGPFGMKMRRRNKNGGITVDAGTYFPVSIAMAATWDIDKVKQITSTIGKEMNAVGAMSNAGPAMNIIRDPRTGRSFEYFTEDPFLNGQIAAAYTKGIQSEKIAAILKHYIVNNQELNRHKVDVQVSERALREIYFPGFETAIKDADAQVIMGAYNKVNGVHSCENDFTLNQVLRKEWGFSGFVLSDWSGTQSTVASANNGLDVEMPRPRWYGDKLLKAVKGNKVSEDVLNTMVKNVLRVVFWSGAFDQGPMYDKNIVRSKSHLEMARTASSDAMVLLKNENNTLPFNLNKIKNIAVIGPNGNYGGHFNNGKYDIGLFQGGGSAKIVSKQQNVITPFLGIKNNITKDVKVIYEPGCYAESGYGLIPTKYLSVDNKEGIESSYYNNVGFKGAPFKKEVNKKLAYNWGRGLEIPEAGTAKNNDKYKFSVAFKSTLKVPATRDYSFEVRNESGNAKIFIDGKLIAENKKGSRIDWNNTGKIKLEKGKAYKLEVKYASFGGHISNLRIGWDYENIQYLERAKIAAKNADAVVLTVGLSAKMGDIEAGDRRTLALPQSQQNLINEISKINKNVAVVLVAGSAVTMNSWLDNVPAILDVWYPGEQGGNAISDVIFGKVNPSGKLPITFPKSYSQYPANFYSYDSKIEYKEDIYVGYRYFDKYKKEVLFPFGHGLSYTDFKYSKLKVSTKKNTTNVCVKIENTGNSDGADVIQLYIRDLESSVDRPLKELKAFKKVYLKKGEKMTIEFNLTERAFAFWDDVSKDWKVESGEFEILIGKSSKDIILKKIINIKR